MRKILVIPIILILSISIGATPAFAGGDCGVQYVVQPGDTLYHIATSCGYTVEQVVSYNPGLSAYIYPGQVIYFVQQGWQETPNYYGTSYTVQPGDTLYKVAAKFGITQESLANANQLATWSWLYTGQLLTIPSYSYPKQDTWHQHYEPQLPQAYVPIGYQTYMVQRGDTLRILANEWGTTVWDILRVNPQIYNANVLYAGQVINTPFTGGVQAGSYYTVQPGDTLRIIAGYYGKTVYDLLALNPTIWNPNIIYVGSVVRVQ